MITDIKEYMSLPKEERQKHLNLSAPCVERGGNSTNHRGVLAQYLNTAIPISRQAILAHACNNGSCSNPEHLYWATDRENIVEDGIKFGTWKNAWERTVDKYGLEEAKKMQARGNKSAGGKANKDKPKSEEHKKNLSNAIKENYRLGLINTSDKGRKLPGRKRKMPYEELLNMVAQHGIPKTAELLNESYQSVRSRYYSAKKKLTNTNK